MSFSHGSGAFGNKFFAAISAVSDSMNELALQNRFFSAVICAAGSGSRMGSATGDSTKQLLQIGGMPVVARTIAQFEACPFIREIIVAAREDELSVYSELRELYGFKKLKDAVLGGETRQQSAAEAFKYISKKADFVAIHDAARCLITPEMIASVCRAAVKHRAAAAATHALDTVKIADSHGFIAQTPDRSLVWNVQTPQIFDVNLYSAALHFAEKDGLSVTDDCSLSEHIGFPPKLVDCGTENIKITVPTDLIFAETILKKRETDE